MSDSAPSVQESALTPAVLPAGNTQAVQVHQLSKHSSQNPFRKNRGRVVRVLFHPLKPFLFVATQNHVRIYNLAKQELAKKLMGASGIASMAVHSSGDHVLVGCEVSIMAGLSINFGFYKPGLCEASISFVSVEFEGVSVTASMVVNHIGTMGCWVMRRPLGPVMGAVQVGWSGHKDYGGPSGTAAMPVLSSCYYILVSCSQTGPNDTCTIAQVTRLPVLVAVSGCLPARQSA